VVAILMLKGYPKLSCAARMLLKIMYYRYNKEGNNQQ
jgi:hypothetical protein